MAESDKNARRSDEAERSRHISASESVAFATMLLGLLGRGVGRLLDDPAAAEPVYGRPAEAQAQWEARHGRPFPDSSGHAG